MVLFANRAMFPFLNIQGKQKEYLEYLNPQVYACYLIIDQFFYFADSMDEQEDYNFYRIEESAEHMIRSQSPNLHYDNSPIEQEINHVQFKAINPYEASKNLPEKQREVYLKMLQSGKFHPGLLHIFEQEQEELFPGVTQQINECMLEQSQDQVQSLKWLFEPNKQDEAIKHEKIHQEMRVKIEQISVKFFDHMNPNKCITVNFFERFDNFVYLHGEQNFLKGFEISMIEFLGECKKIKGPSIDLFLSMYDFWMKMFKSFIQDIFKYSEKYTLNFIKKKVGTDNSNFDCSSSNIEGKSGNSSRINDPDRRKPWKQSEIQLLEKLIAEKTIFSAALLNRLGEQLNRTPVSISNKLQKLTKKKETMNPDFVVDDNITLFDRITAVLQHYPQGLSRKSIIQRINEHYQMGGEDIWTKSVAQLLSSRPQFAKIKGVYGLYGVFEFDINKKTFKDKVVNCLLKCPNQKGDLKKLVDAYINIYGHSEGANIFSEKRKKQIESSFSKALSRYPIFDKSQSQTVYKLREYCSPQDLDGEIESYIN